MGVHIESKAPESQLKNPSRCINYDVPFAQVTQPLSHIFGCHTRIPSKEAKKKVIMFTSVRPPEIYSDVLKSMVTVFCHKIELLSILPFIPINFRPKDIDFMT